jgi:hypothetical protein
MGEEFTIVAMRKYHFGGIKYGAAFRDSTSHQRSNHITYLEIRESLFHSLIVGSLSGSRLKSVRFLVGESSGAVASYGAVKIIKINH